MKKICLGTMINLLYQARARKADQVRDVCRRMFAAFNCNIDGYDKALPSHLKSGHDPVPKDIWSIMPEIWINRMSIRA